MSSGFDYQRYLASREWALLKEQVRARSGGICERCYRNPHEQTHHVTYARVGHERLEDLQGVCGGCHQWLSAKSPVDPARCAIFCVGPVNNDPMAGWIGRIANYLLGYALIVPIRGPRGGRSSEVVAWNRLAISQSCGMVAFMDHGNRVGTVVDVMTAIQLRKPVLLIDVAPSVGVVLHPVRCECSRCWGHGGEREASEAWYLAERLLQSQDDASLVMSRDVFEDDGGVVNWFFRWRTKFTRQCRVRHIADESWRTCPSVCVIQPDVWAEESRRPA